MTAGFNRWRADLYTRATAKHPERRAKFHTSSGIELEPIYIPSEDGEGYDEKIGFPGEYPPVPEGGSIWVFGLKD